MTRRTWTMLVVLAVLAVRAGSARADTAAVVIGGASSAELASVTDGARAAVTRAKWIPVDHTLPKDRVAAAVTCAEQDDRSDCAPRLLAEADAERLVVLKLHSDKYEGKPVRVVTARVLGGAGEVLAIGQRFCEGCTGALLEMHVGELVGELLQQAKGRLAPATLVVRSSPDKARVAVDGTVVGVTELEYGVAAGKRQVRIEKEGFAPQVLEVVISDGERRELDVELTPTEARDDRTVPEVPPPVDRPSRLAPWLVIGTGAAAVVTGAILLAVDEDEVQDGAYQREWTDTATPGVVVGVVGLVGVAAGVAWLLSIDDAPSDRVSPVVTFDAGRAQLGIRGSF